MPVLSFEVQVRHDHNTCPVCPGVAETLPFSGQTLRRRCGHGYAGTSPPFPYPGVQYYLTSRAAF